MKPRAPAPAPGPPIHTARKNSRHLLAALAMSVLCCPGVADAREAVAPVGVETPVAEGCSSPSAHIAGMRRVGAVFPFTLSRRTGILDLEPGRYEIHVQCTDPLDADKHECVHRNVPEERKWTTEEFKSGVLYSYTCSIESGVIKYDHFETLRSPTSTDAASSSGAGTGMKVAIIRMCVNVADAAASRSVTLEQSSGDAQIDDAAIRYGNAMPYAPATSTPASFCRKLAVKFMPKDGTASGGSSGSSGGAPEH